MTARASSKARQSKSKAEPAPMEVPDPVPSASIEFIAQQCDDFAKHLWAAKNEKPGSPEARVYRIALEHLQTAALWLRTTQ